MSSINDEDDARKYNNVTAASAEGIGWSWGTGRETAPGGAPARTKNRRGRAPRTKKWPRRIQSDVLSSVLFTLLHNLRLYSPQLTKQHEDHSTWSRSRCGCGCGEHDDNKNHKEKTCGRHGARGENVRELSSPASSECFAPRAGREIQQDGHAVNCKNCCWA